jgi:two-component system, chemotaxis family, sensor kinase CheA
METIIQKFKAKFIEEAQALLNNYESDLLELEKHPGDTQIIESAFRSMHTLKGTSGMYGFEFIAKLTHQLESIFQEIRDKKIEFNRELFETTFSVIDILRKLLFDESLADTATKEEYQRLMVIVSNFSYSATDAQPLQLNQQKDKVNSKSIWQILLRTTELQFFRGINFMNIFKELSSLGCFDVERVESLSNSESETWIINLVTDASEENIREVLLFIEDDCTITKVAEEIDSLNSPGNSTNENQNAKAISILEVVNTHNNQKANSGKPEIADLIPRDHKNNRISVDTDKLDHLMFLVSELITVNSQLSLSTKDNLYNSIRNNIEKVESLSMQFRNNALDLRLVPLNDIVLRFQRLIRDLSKKLDKKIEFQTQGTENELDKSTIDQLPEPLMHIIRNCIDHGIETPEHRKKRGKPETGVIKLTSYNSGGKVFIKIEDDGNGIDIEKVRNKAIGLGLLQPNETVSKKEIFDFIFVPGFSTAQSLTSVSGRGVGMDVVRKRIQDLHGDIVVESVEGVGTSFTLVLQQSVSIIDSLLFKVSNSFFTIPISDINICGQIKDDELEFRKHTETIPFGDQLIPYFDMRKNLHLNGSYSKKIKLIILKNNGQMLAILADKIIGQHQAVLKPLGKSFKKQGYITSASQLGDGNLALMIDTNEMLKNIVKRDLKHV